VLGAGAYLGYQLWFGNKLTDSATLPVGPVSYQFVSSRPEAHLVYPGAQLAQNLGGGEQGNPIEGGSSSAFAGAILTTPDSPRDIYGWYRAQLESRHYHPYDILSSPVWISEQGYERGPRERVIVALDDPAALAKVLGHAIPKGNTVFEVRYMIFPAKG
jgi:hypothetical protein